MAENDPSVPTPEQRKHWRLMEQWEQAEINVATWTAKLETCKKYLKKWKAKAARLKALLETEETEDIKQRSAAINADWTEAS